MPSQSHGNVRVMPRQEPPSEDEEARFRLKPPRLDLLRLHLFATVAQSGSLTAAGDLLNIPQSIMSRHLARLEKDFGGKLFERNGRGVVLSDLGARLLPLARGLLAQAAELEQAADDFESEPGGDVRIGLPWSLRGFLTVPLFFSLKERHPRVRLTLKEGSSQQIEHWLRSGEIGLGLSYRYGCHSELQSDKLLSLDMYLVGPPGDEATRNESVEFRSIAGLPLILPNSPSEFRSRLDRTARSLNVTLDVIMEAEFGQIQADLARMGAYCITTWHVVAEHVRKGELQAALILDPVIKRDISLVYSPNKTGGHSNRAVAQVIKEILSSDAVLDATQR